MNNVDVSVLRDTDGNYYPNGLADTISSNAKQTGEFYLASEELSVGSVYDVKEGDVVNKSHPVSKVKVLRVELPAKGALYIDDTPQSFLDKVQACCTTTTTVPPTTVA